MLCSYLIDIYDNHIHPQLVDDDFFYSKLIEYKILLKYDEVVEETAVKINYQFDKYVKYLNKNNETIFYTEGSWLYWYHKNLWLTVGDLKKHNKNDLMDYLIYVTNKHPLFKNKNYRVGWDNSYIFNN
jgi:hypothetical protein